MGLALLAKFAAEIAGSRWLGIGKAYDGLKTCIVIDVGCRDDCLVSENNSKVNDWRLSGCSARVTEKLNGVTDGGCDGISIGYD